MTAQTKPAPKTGTVSRKPRPKIDRSNESKRERFLRLGRPRMSKALKAIAQLGNLSGSAYEYNDVDVQKMNDALADAVEAAMGKFAPKAKEKAAAFDF